MSNLRLSILDQSPIISGGSSAEALHPNRIDLGMGRARCGDRMTANAMNAHAFDDMEGFPRQVMEVVGWLDRTLPEEHPYAMVCAFALCAETDAEAQRLAASIDHRRLLMAIGREAPIATVQEAQAYPYTERDRTLIERERARSSARRTR